MLDYHIHPNFSIDADGEMEEFCQAALDAGLKEIAFTTHLDTDRVAEDCYVNVKGQRVDVSSSIWFEEYETSVRLLEDRYRDQNLRVLLGVEVDCYPHVEDVLPERFYSTDFDLIIGAVHLIDHIAISADGRAEEAFRRYSIGALGEKYYSTLIDSIDLDIFDILAHIDLYRRHGELFYGESIHDLWQPHLHELARKMLSKGVGFEVNTSSLRRGMQQPMPEERIIRALKNECIELVTVGSDAHTPHDVGKGVEKALDLLRSSGFSGPSIFRKRKATIIQWSNLVGEKQN